MSENSFTIIEGTLKLYAVCYKNNGSVLETRTKFYVIATLKQNLKYNKDQKYIFRKVEVS